MIADYPPHMTEDQKKRADELSRLIDAIEQSPYQLEESKGSAVQLKAAWKEYNDLVYPLDKDGKDIVPKPRRDPGLRQIFDSLVRADHFWLRPPASKARHNLKVKDEAHAPLIYHRLELLSPMYEQYDALKLQAEEVRTRILDLEAEIRVLCRTKTVETQLFEATQKS